MKSINKSFNSIFVKVLNFDKALAILILFCILYIVKAIHFPTHDFSNYYFGGKFLETGNFNSTIYFPYLFNKAIADLGYQNLFVSYAPNTPFSAILFAPFSLISIAKAKIIFNIISSILLVFSIYKLFCFYKINSKYILLIPILFLIPIKNNLLFGQVYFLLFFLLSQGLIAYEKQQFKKMAFYFSFSIFLKVFPIVFILIFVFKKQLKPLLYTIGICSLFFGISVVFTGFDIWVFWLDSVFSKASNGEIASSFVDNYQSVFMFLKRLLVFDITENPNSFYHNTVLFSGLILGFKIFLISLGYFVTNKNPNNLFAFCYWVLVSYLISPYGCTYGFILLLFLFITILKKPYSIIQKCAFFLLLFLINNIPISFFIDIKFPFTYLRLFLLVVLFLAFIFQINKTINYKIVVLLTVLLVVILMVFKEPKANKSESFSNYALPILVYDYKIINNKLTYFYWDEKGENEKIWKLNFESFLPLKIKNNQIFYNKKQLTSDNSNKLNPVLIDGKTILYLSDFDRGIGFYSLRKIEIN